MPSEIKPGCLYLVATPIGNLEDMTLRAVRVLGEVDVVAAEDTRSARALMAHFKIKTSRLVSYFKGNEAKRSQELLRQLQEGRSVALITESGMPGISDPGARIVERCIASGVEVDLIPGPSASLTALVLSGLRADRFCFLGFLPRRGPRRQEILEQLTFEPGSIVIYEAPTRVGRTLFDLLAALGDRRAVMARELTKLHQELVRGTLAQLVERCREQPPRGEVTLVVEGCGAEGPLPDDAIVEEIRSRLERGQSLRAVADALAAHGRRRVYQIALRLKDRST